MSNPSRKWRYLALTLLIAATGLVLADRNLRQAPHAGFVNPNANWRLATASLPQAWNDFDSTTYNRALIEEDVHAIANLQLEIRKRLGIRPTPSRWRLWLGDPFTLSSFEGNWVACTHPGLLARLWDSIARPLFGLTETNGIVEANGVAYAWHEGFLLFGETLQTLEQFRNAMTPVESATDYAAAVVWRGTFADRPASAHVTFTGNMPVSLALENVEEFQSNESAEEVGESDSDIVRIQGLSANLARELLEEAFSRLPIELDTTPTEDAWRTLPGTPSTVTARLIEFQTDAALPAATPKIELQPGNKPPTAYINWPRLAEDILKADTNAKALRAASNLEERETEDETHDAIPWIRALEPLGVARLEGAIKVETLKFSGNLTN